MSPRAKSLTLHLGVLAILLALGFVAPAYHHANLARIMVLASFAIGYNIAFGYTGLLSLGHALFFAAGLYAAGLSARYFGWGALPALALGILAGTALAALIGLLALRTQGVSFMIVTLMFAQAGYMTILYFTPVTGGEYGFTLTGPARDLAGLDLTNETTRYLAAWTLLALSLLGCLALVRSRFGRVMVAMRENEARSRMLGYDPFRVKLISLMISGLVCGTAGAFWGLAFGYVGAGFAGTQYSILALLYTLTGGAGTVLGPLLGALLKFYLTDLASEVTDAYLLVVGVALIVLVLFAPRGLLGWLRIRLRWLP